MPMVVATLASSASDIIGHAYFNNANAPLYVFAASLLTVANAANAWADALVSYCLTATVLGVPAVPADLTSRQPAMATSLAAQFAINNDPNGAATAIFNALGILWTAVLFPNGYLVSQVDAGKAAAITAFASLGAVPSPVSLHNELAAIIDTYLKTIAATQVAPPNAIVFLL